MYTMEYHSAPRKYEILPFVTTWMDFEIITLSEISQGKLRTLWFHSHVEYKTESNKRTGQTETHGHGQWIRGHQREGERREVDKGKGVKYAVMVGNLTLGGEHTMQDTDDVLLNGTLETYIILLTTVTR